MNHRGMLVILLLFIGGIIGIGGLAIGWTPTLAQTNTPTPTAESTIAASTPEATTAPVADDKRAYISLDLQAGFPLDPFFVSVNGGGSVKASTLASNCTGYISQNPIVTVNWKGQADLVRAFVYSDADSTLVVQTPEGKYACGDDAGAMLLDPTLTLSNPSEGRYRVWVGTSAPNQLIPSILVLTTRSDITLGTFDLGNLVKRPTLPESPNATPEAFSASALGAATSRYAGQVGMVTASSPATISIKSEGAVPAFDLKLGTTCNGFVDQQPVYVFNWSGNVSNLTVYFEGARDTSLLVVTPSGQILCNDDSADGANANPVIPIPSPTDGRYAVFVGRLTPDYVAEGKLVVTSAADAKPAVLSPEQ